jgi:hypothetical protein
VIRALIYAAVGVAVYYYAALPTADLLVERMLRIEQVFQSL